MRVTTRLHRIGSGIVNAYLVEEAGAVTIIDAGVPTYWKTLPNELAAMGRSLADVRAVLLTHGHTDHRGFAERIRRERGVPVHIHQDDADLARGAARNPSRGIGPSRFIPIMRFLWFAIRTGLMRTHTLREVITFGDGATLDLPGAPRVILVPGHTPGSAALHVAALDALFVGDAIATFAVTTGARGPQIAPFTADPVRALQSLDRLDGIEARYVLPGHGEVWVDGVAAAVTRVRARHANSLAR